MKQFSLLFAAIFSVHFIVIALPAGCCPCQKAVHTDKKCCCNENKNHRQCHSETTIQKYCGCQYSISSENKAIADKVKNVIIKKTPDIYKSNELIHHLNNRIAQLTIHFPNKRVYLDKIPLFRPLRI